MNRRNCLKLLAALLPCAVAARMLGEKDLHGTPSPNPAWKTKPYEAMMFSPTTGFHTEIREVDIPGFYEDGTPHQPFFRAIITDCSKNPAVRKCAINSPSFIRGDSKTYRFALTVLYQNINWVIRRTQFPKDTLICDSEITENGIKYTNPRYPNE